MSWTKRQIVITALETIGIASYTFDIQPEELQSSLTRLDAMMASWNAKGILLGYNAISNPDNSNIDADSGIPDSANEATYLNLAVRLAPLFGKMLASDIKAQANFAYNAMLAQNAFVPQMQGNRTVPAGATNRGATNVFLNAPSVIVNNIGLPQPF